MKKHQLLNNQICFPVYTLSRLIMKVYTPLLEPYGLTYTQYLVLMLLWEKGTMRITDITSNLFLETNTISPVLKRLEKLGYIQRKKGESDVRVTYISLTSSGKDLKQKLEPIPKKVFDTLNAEIDEIQNFKSLTEKYIDNLQY